LDAKRFELRQIYHQTINDIRCIYDETFSRTVKKLLDKKIVVIGKVELLDNKPRLMEVNKIIEPDKDKINNRIFE
jgi:hypothetical protein